MEKITKYLRKTVYNFRKQNKKSVIVCVVLKVLIILCMIFRIIKGDWESVSLCILSLMLFLLPQFIADKFNIEFPSLLEVLIFMFIFSAEILGEINNFYNIIPYWDTVLHTTNGFLAAGIGFSLIDILNKSIKPFNLSAIFVSIVAICFSMTIGVCWEFFEFSQDMIFKTDMQKDRSIKNISSIYLNSNQENNAIKVKDISTTTIKLDNGKTITIENGYIDIGLIDTMKDLIVNFLGAIMFSILSYLYIKNTNKYKFAENFIPKKIE